MTATPDSAGKRFARRIYELIPGKQIAFGAIRGKIRLPQRCYRHLHFTGVIDVPVAKGASFKIQHHGFQVENDLFWAGYGNGFECTSLALWAQLARTSGTILDVGANTGIFALAAKAISPQANVVAFEPMPKIAALLRRNVALNPFEIDVVEMGVSRSSGKATIYTSPSDFEYSSSMSADFVKDWASVQECEISITSLDDFAAGRVYTSVDLIKIDVESHEVEALDGARGMIEKFKPLIIIEVLTRGKGEVIDSYCEQMNYLTYCIREGDGLVRHVPVGSRRGNYFLCPRNYAEIRQLPKEISHENLAAVFDQRGANATINH